MSIVVVLDGTSSSGKTALARAIQEAALPRLFLNVSIDTILYSLPPSELAAMQTGGQSSSVDVPLLVTGFYRCARELLNLGHNLVIDHALTASYHRELLADTIRGHRSLLVAVECPAEVLEQRERSRGDRPAGLAAAQLPAIHRALTYDLRIDSSTTRPEEGARAILDRIADKGPDAR